MMEKAIDAMLQIQREQLEARGESEQRTHELLMAQQETIRRALELQGRWHDPDPRGDCPPLRRYVMDCRRSGQGRV